MFYNSEQTALFKDTLIQVVGQALNAAGYYLEQADLQQARGLVRFRKPLADDIYYFVEWQLLAFAQSPVSRYRITLLRNQGKDARATTQWPQRTERTLPWVMWHAYSARVLPTDDHWWEFRDSIELAHSLAASGKLLFGYGVPWLDQYHG